MVSRAVNSGPPAQRESLSRPFLGAERQQQQLGSSWLRAASSEKIKKKPKQLPNITSSDCSGAPSPDAQSLAQKAANPCQARLENTSPILSGCGRGDAEGAERASDRSGAGNTDYLRVPHLSPRTKPGVGERTRVFTALTGHAEDQRAPGRASSERSPVMSDSRNSKEQSVRQAGEGLGVKIAAAVQKKKLSTGQERSGESWLELNGFDPVLAATILLQAHTSRCSRHFVWENTSKRGEIQMQGICRERGQRWEEK